MSKKLLFELEEIDQKFYELKKTFSWLIGGLGVHGLKISDAKHIDWNWIKENYNVEEFRCRHKKVEGIGYVVGFGDDKEPLFVREYDGFCNVCNKTVYGKTTTLGEPIKKWR